MKLRHRPFKITQYVRTNVWPSSEIILTKLCFFLHFHSSFWSAEKHMAEDLGNGFFEQNIKAAQYHSTDLRMPGFTLGDACLVHSSSKTQKTLQDGGCANVKSTLD